MNRKNKKEEKPRPPARFAAGAQVRVKPGITVPPFEDIPLGGWAGTVREVDQRSAPPTYLIEWDRRTLGHMHPVYRKRCERDGLELESMWLGEDDIEPATGGPAVPGRHGERGFGHRPVRRYRGAVQRPVVAHGGPGGALPPKPTLAA
jgi:hypothetical protein